MWAIINEIVLFEMMNALLLYILSCVKKKNQDVAMSHLWLVTYTVKFVCSKYFKGESRNFLEFSVNVG